MSEQQNRDEWLMAEARDGQRAALEALIRRHGTRLLSFLQRMAGDAHRAEDLFQETCLALWVKRRTYVFPRPFKPWLYAIAANKCRTAFRYSEPAAPLPELDKMLAAAGQGDSPPETAVAAETATLVARAVALLPSQQRVVVVLRVWEQLSYAEIGEIVDCSETTARSHMHHGLCALRKILEPDM